MRAHPVFRRSILLIGFATLAAACHDLCGNEVVEDVASPSGRNHAVVFMRNCGATTGFSVQVSVLPSGKKLANETGNAFIADAAQTNLHLHVSATWDSDRLLRLTFDPRLRMFRRERAIGDVTLVYPAAP